MDKLANKYEVQPVALNNYAGLSEIEVPSEKIKPIPEEKETRLEIVHKKALEIAQNAINKRLRPEKIEDEAVSNDIQALRNVVARPATPNWKHDEGMVLREWKSGITKNELKEEANNQRKSIRREVAVLFLQRILRGRAQQNIMYEGK